MKIRLHASTIEELQFKSIGQRIRILREELQKINKSDFTGKTVASRLANVSQSKLNFIERGETSSIDAQLLYDISKDFGVPMDIFFDDFYSNVSIKNAVYLEPKIYQPLDDCIQHVQNPNNVNPLEETKFTLNVQLKRVASNGDYQIVSSDSTHETHDIDSLKIFLIQIRQAIELIDYRVNPLIHSHNNMNNHFKSVEELAKHIINPHSAFPFFPQESIDKLNALYDEALQYTAELQEELEQQEDDKDEKTNRNV